MFRRLLLGLLLTAHILCGGCTNSHDQPNVIEPYAYTTPVAANVTPPGEQRVYNDGVYYFDVSGNDFALSLAAFKHHHPELVVTAIGSHVYNDGYTTKYFISTEPRTQCACGSK